MKKYFIKSTLDISPKSIKLQTKNSLLFGYKIFHISDLHIDQKTSFGELQNLIQTLNSLECNIVIISGDFIDTAVKNIEDKLLLFKELQHKTYYVSGNHDLMYGYKELHALLKKCGLISLDNLYLYEEYNNTQIMLVGLSDKFSKYFHIQRQEKKLIAEVKKKQEAKIFVAHQPKDYTYALESKSDLFLCGHTHGGQIYPFHYLVRLVQPFIAGVHYVKNLTVYVNSGIGAWGIKYRFLAQSELTIIELV